jgi:hypothetical protein
MVGMSRWAVGALRAVIVAALVGSAFVQTVMVALLWADLDGAPAARRVAVVTIAVLGIAVVQVCAVCVWRLLSMVTRDTVFRAEAMRYVDTIIAAIAVGAVLVFSFGVVLAPGEAVAPGVVLLVGGLGVLVTGVALVVAVLRLLLTQATRLRTELDAVI